MSLIAIVLLNTVQLDAEKNKEKKPHLAKVIGPIVSIAIVVINLIF